MPKSESSEIIELQNKCIALKKELSRLDFEISQETNDREGTLIERHDRLFLELGELQGKLAEAKGQPFVLPLETLVSSHMTAPAPFLLAGTQSTRLIYRPDKNWREENVESVEEINLNPDSSDQFVILTLHNSNYAKLGRPSLDCVEQSEFWNAGLKGFHFVEIRNSPLIDHLIKVEKKAEEFSSYCWKDAKHLLLYFHDESFECLCQSWSSSVVQGSRSEVIDHIFSKV